jgi:hypothetical protein
MMGCIKLYGIKLMICCDQHISSNRQLVIGSNGAFAFYLMNHHLNYQLEVFLKKSFPKQYSQLVLINGSQDWMTK